MRLKLFFLQFILLICFASSAQSKINTDLKIRLFSNLVVDKAVVTPDTGLYFLIAYDKKLNLIDTVYDIYDQDSIRTLYFKKNGSSVVVNRGKESLGSYDAIRIASKDKEKEFKISANRKNRVYQDDLQIRVYSGHLQIVNIVEINKYVAGVVESEGGHVNELEYFKAQAVLARTFALKNLEKHADEGYNLKDDVSSQVYFSKCHYKNANCIIEAVETTRDTVVVTEECQPILGVFHANSGGQTVGSDHAWYSSIEYLQPQLDSFSVGVGSYYWEKKISKNTFYDYVARRMKVSNDLALKKALLNFNQSERKAYFVFKSRRLKLTAIRNKFKLKSTFFKITEEGNNIVLKGRGYGHGVGMSQDGAIVMSSKGYSYRSILQFYYHGVELESLSRISLD